MIYTITIVHLFKYFLFLNIFIDKKNEFIHDLVEIVKQKLQLDLPVLIQKVKEQPNLFDGYISEALQFDNILRNTYEYYPSNIRELELISSNENKDSNANDNEKESGNKLDVLKEYQWEGCSAIFTEESNFNSWVKIEKEGKFY